MYQYKARVLDVHDGDTMNLEVDLGCNITIKMAVRLYGINAPEMRTPEGVTSRDYVRGLLPTDREVWIRTIRDTKEKYGRYLGRVFLDRASMENNEVAYCINDMLIAAGLAVAYKV